MLPNEVWLGLVPLAMLPSCVLLFLRPNLVGLGPVRHTAKPNLVGFGHGGIES